MASPKPLGAAGRRDAELWLHAAATAARRQMQAEWFGAPPHLYGLGRGKAEGFAAFPRDFRPARAESGKAILVGTFVLAGDPMAVGPGGDPWDRPSPSRAFAAELHGFSWLRHLLATGEEGARESLRLILGWRRTFGGWNPFSWSGEVLERRVINLSCAAGALCAHASDAEVEMLADLLGRHARQLMGAADPVWRRTERTVAAGLASAALAGPGAARLLARTLDRINRMLPKAVLPDGGHVSRSPEAGLELLLDLLALDDAWAQRGFETPVEAARAIDRLTAALRFFTLADGRLACFQGGEESDAALIAAARLRDDPQAAPPPAHAPHSGYQRMAGPRIQVMVDVGRPAPDPWSVTACAQAGAIEVVCGKDRLITSSGWSPRAPQAQAQRLTGAASAASVGHGSAGAPLSGWRARTLGPRLVGGPGKVEVKRTVAAEAGIWLDLAHDGWLAEFGLSYERRLFLDLAADELRGEDVFTPAAAGPDGKGGGEKRVIPYLVHFHVPPEVEAVLARDNRSVLLRGASEKGWWLRNDATDVRVEPAVHFREGRQISTLQVLLMGHLRADKGGRVRWKLVAVE